MTTTIKDLENMTNRINAATGHPNTPAWNNTPNAYTLSGAYGGYKLERNSPDGHGVSSVWGMDGYTSKKELHQKLTAFLSGIDAARSK